MAIKKIISCLIVLIICISIGWTIVNLDTPRETLSKEADKLYGINNYTIVIYNCGIDSCVYKSIYPNFKINTIDFCGIMAIPNNDSYCKDLIHADD